MFAVCAGGGCLDICLFSLSLEDGPTLTEILSPRAKQPTNLKFKIMDFEIFH